MLHVPKEVGFSRLLRGAANAYKLSLGQCVPNGVRSPNKAIADCIADRGEQVALAVVEMLRGRGAVKLHEHTVDLAHGA